MATEPGVCFRGIPVAAPSGAHLAGGRTVGLCARWPVPHWPPRLTVAGASGLSDAGNRCQGFRLCLRPSQHVGVPEQSS